MSTVPPYILCFPPTGDQKEKEEESQIYQKHEKFIATLPQSSQFLQSYLNSYLYKGFWFPNGSFMNFKALTGTLVCHEHFKSKASDIILATMPKVGTTWLKALIFSTVNRNDKPYPQSLLRSLNPHQCVPSLEFQLYTSNLIPNLDLLPSPRLLATHNPFSLLPPSVLECEACKIVYLCRNPKDTIISLWKFANALEPDELPGLEDFSEAFLLGFYPFGPYWDNVIEYWKASIDMPNKVLFMKYEDLKRDTSAQLKRVAKFIGHEFSEREKKEGVVEEIMEMCSLESLRALEVNQTASTVMWDTPVQNKAFFRKGEVGNFNKIMSPQMIERFDKVTKEKFKDTGLSFE